MLPSIAPNIRNMPAPANQVMAGPPIPTSIAAPHTYRYLVTADMPVGVALLASPTFTGTVSLPTAITLSDGAIITGGTSTGTKIGAITTNKLGFFGATPVIQQTGDILTALSNLGLVTSGTILPIDIPALVAATDASTVTLDISVTRIYSLLTTSGVGTNRILALSNVPVGRPFSIIIIQDSTGSRTVTWFSTIKWANGVTPTLTTTANKADVFTFICYSAGNYYGAVAMPNL